MRLAALKTKAADTLTDAEKTELADLEAKCKAAGLEVDFIVENFAPDAEEADEKSNELSEEELANVIKSAVGEALKDTGKADEIVKAISEKLVEVKGLSSEDVDKIVAKHAGAGNSDAIVAAIKAALPSQGVTMADMKKLFDDLAASIKQPREYEYASEDMDFPIEHRSGNMPVHEKQLLNLCLMNVSENAKQDTIRQGGTIPTSLNDGISAKQLENAQKRGNAMLKGLRSGIGGKTITTGGVGEGAELIPVDLSSMLLTRFYLESQLARELMQSEVQMPTDPFKYPMTTTRPQFYVGAESPGTDPTASNPSTKNVTLDAQKLIGMSDYSYESDEDAIIAVLPVITNGLVAGSIAAFEGAVIEGDTTNPHQHADYQAVAAHYTKLFKGFRKYAIAGGLTQDFSTGGINNTNIKATRKALGKYGVDTKRLMIVVGPNAYNDLVGLDETLTFEKVGNANAARILTGEAASIYGMRIVVSGEMREDLNASGVYDGSTTTKGGLLIVDRTQWIVGVRRGFMLEVEVDKKQQVNYVIASFRRAFTPIETPGATAPILRLGYGAAA